LLVGVRRSLLAPADPESNPNWIATRNTTLPAKQLKAADQCGRSRELILRQQAQRVPADHRGTTPRDGVDKPPIDDHKCGQEEIGFCLAATCREPDEVHDFSPGVWVLRDGPRDCEKLKG
jgi:hypothetical protein